MPPPPWELLVIPKPSMLDGLHQKLLGNGLWPVVVFGPQPLGSPAFVLFVSSNVPVGNVPPTGANGSDGKFTPFDNTVMAAPSRAPIRLGSCSISARLPFSVVSHPTVASVGSRSICGLMSVGEKAVQPVPQVKSPWFGVPLAAIPNRHCTRARHPSILPAGCVFALMILEAAPTPCSRTGFHISNSSTCELWV